MFGNDSMVADTLNAVLSIVARLAMSKGAVNNIKKKKERKSVVADVKARDRWTRFSSLGYGYGYGGRRIL